MDITPIIPGDRMIIEAYGPGRFRISGQVHETPVMVFLDDVTTWSPTEAGDIDAESLAHVAKKGVEVLLIGTGAKMHLLPPDVRRALREQGIGIEVMDTGAACRTFNILMAESRQVAAALLPIT
ncbi:MAG: Mth938-like domain-containing protein [Pseudomonadota bacterium]